MVSDIRLRRLSEVVKQRATRAILYELKDPRVGFVTVTRVKLARDLTNAVVFWSIIGSDGDRSKTAHALEDARGFVQSAVAGAMGTRQTPRLTLRYDPSLEKAQKVNEILARLKQERRERGDFDDIPAVGGGDGEESGGAEDGDEIGEDLDEGPGDEGPGDGGLRDGEE